MGLSDEQVKTCQTYVSAFLPPALKEIFGLIDKFSQNVCHMTYDGICSTNDEAEPAGCEYCRKGVSLRQISMK